MGLGAGEVVGILVVGVASLVLGVAPIILVVLLWRRVQRLEARLTELERLTRGPGAA